MDEPVYLKRPVEVPAAGSDPAVRERVSEMLREIERRGVDAVRAYSRELDNWDPPSFEVTSAQVAAASAALPDALRESIAFAQAQIRNFAQLQRATLTDFEAETLPGVFLGQRQVPVSSVGAYCPSGRVPMLACAFMTVLVPKVAGVPSVIACSPPRAGELHAPTLHSIATSGADRIFALGGVQALAAMAFGLLDDDPGPVDMLVGPGNAFVAEAKRQLFGRVGIDLIAGPSETLVIADDSVDAELCATDLLGQAGHGFNTPAILLTNSLQLAKDTIAEVERILTILPTANTAGASWRDYGAVIVTDTLEEMVREADRIASEHVHDMTREPYYFLNNMKNAGALFLGPLPNGPFGDLL